MNSKTTKRALLGSVVAMLVCFSMLLSTTFAWFTDTVTSANNKIVSGTLKIDLEVLGDSGFVSIKNDSTPLFNYEKWEPGYTEYKILKIENEGTLALKWYATFSSTNALSELADVIDVYVCPGETTAPTDRDLTGYTKVGTLRDFVGTLESTTNGVLYAQGEAGSIAYLGIALKMQETAGNEYQDKTIGAFDITIFATQLNHESDSFDSTYDINAEYDNAGSNAPSAPTFFVGSAADLAAALTPTVSNDEVKIVLTQNVELVAGEDWTPLVLAAYGGTVRNIVIDGQGHTIKGLNAPLIGHAYFGNTSIEIKNLTIANANIVGEGFNGTGLGAFVGTADSTEYVILENCHLVDSTITCTNDVTGVGGIIGFSSSPLTMTDCSVTNTTVTGPDDSVGAIIGHTYKSTITNAKVVGCTLTGSGANKTGFVVGTVNADTTITTSPDCAGNTVFGVADSTTVYGRIAGATLTLNGATIS